MVCEPRRDFPLKKLFKKTTEFLLLIFFSQSVMGLSQCIHKGFSLVLDFSGQAARFGVRENDKLVTINGKTPRNVDDAVGVIKQAGNNIKLVKLNILFSYCP